ncbi:MAG: alpha/beta hydrolase-fold protein [Bacteroidia bacterium]|nr:alpha/beta hydrolase-fold protein [Bacteroidia bacterium]
MMKRIVQSIVLLVVMSSTYSQVDKFTIGEIHSFTSEILKEERKIALYLPQDYQQSGKNYQVLYLLDGEWNFPFVASLSEKLVASGDMPPLIIVGILNNNRNKDLTPPGKNDNKTRFGGGEFFLKFLTEELKPWIEEKYRTHPYSILAGHSFGGLFSIYAMMKQPDQFQAFISLSPSLGRNGEQQIRIAQDFFPQKTSFPKSLYLAIGDESGYTYSSSQKFQKLLQKKLPEEMRFKFELLNEENHVSMTIGGFVHALKFLYEGYNPEHLGKLDEIFLVESHYEDLSKRYGHLIPIPEQFYQTFTAEQISFRDYEYALYILSKYKAAYPLSLEMLAQYATVYLLKGEFEEAKKYYMQLKDQGVEDENLEKILQQIDRK